MHYKKTGRLPGGIHTALVTPFCGGETDMSALGRLLDIQLRSRVSGVVLLGTTGEAPTVREDERQRMLLFASERISGKKTLTAGCGSNDTAKACRATKQAESLGADFVLVVAPYYSKPSQRGLLRHFLTVAEASPLPVVVYNVPSRTGVDISVETLEVLSAHPNIVACKEASTDMGQVIEKLERISHLDFFCGSDTLFYQFLSAGAKGSVAVCSNIEPDMTCEIYEKYGKGEIKEAKALFSAMYPFYKALCCDTNPVPIKTVMEAAGLISGEVRQPLCGISDEKRATLLSAAAEAGVYIK